VCALVEKCWIFIVKNWGFSKHLGISRRFGGHEMISVVSGFMKYGNEKRRKFTGDQLEKTHGTLVEFQPCETAVVGYFCPVTLLSIIDSYKYIDNK
jgi:hypothetical protein